MKYLIFIIPFLVSCNTIDRINRSNKVEAEWEAKKVQIKKESEERSKVRQDRLKVCDNLIVSCEQKSIKEELIKCSDDLKSCDYDYSTEGKAGVEPRKRIKSISQKCNDFGYENASSPHFHGKEIKGNFKTLEDCQKESPKGFICIQKDWCRGNVGIF